MKATETNLLAFLKQPKQFVIPIYQRTYSWTIKQCKQLWDDIIRVSRDETISGHFLGSVVYIQGGIYQVATVDKLLVIDGQQRLTTISLLLAALGEVIETSEDPVEINRRKIQNYFLFNNDEEGEDRYKLILTQSDKDTFIKLIEQKPLSELTSPRIIENYEYFANQIKKSNCNLNPLYTGISKLLIVDISLDRDKDNPQLIFESLNSTGLDLSQADLIRNYILMGLEPKQQKEIYDDYWYPMEQNFGQTGYTEKFDQFMRYYLTIKSKSGSLPNIRDIYRDFKEYHKNNSHLSIKEIVQNINRFSKYFVRLAFNKETDPDIAKVIKDINQLKIDVAYPFLLEIYDDFNKNLIGKKELIDIFRLVESYVFRRAICGIPTNSMNKTFAGLSRDIDQENYLESVQLALTNMTAYKRFPDQQEFRQELMIKDLYNFRNCRYLLEKIENYERPKELIDSHNYTIEHIMPQNHNLPLEWQTELGKNWQEIQSKYLHTLGNLTLTAHNSSLGDRSFWEKRDIKDGFADSPLKLNRSLANLENWNEETIKNRAKTLADIAITIWSIPSVNIHNKSYQNHVNNYEQYLQGKVLELFQAIRQRILSLHPSVSEQYKKRYIAYKINRNFVDINPLKSRLKLYINLSFEEIDDPQSLCRDVSNIGHYGNGEVEANFSCLEQIEDIMFLVKQSYNKCLINAK